MFKFLITSLGILACSLGISQNFTVSGFIKDASNGEDVIGATISVEELSGIGTASNVYGFYSLTLPKGTYTLVFSSVGLSNSSETIQLNQDIELSVELGSSSEQLQEVIVNAERNQDNVQTTKMSTVEMTSKEIKSIPALMGEADVLKAIQLLPGVQSGGEGNTGLYVRGGGPDQNLVLLDEAVVYNTGHLFGFFSVFNADAVKNTTLIKGGMPAKYGGRLSSVVDITMRDGNSKEFQADGGIGLLSSRLTVQGPIVKDKSSFMISGRRTYIDVLIAPFVKGTRAEGNSYYFYDLSAKLNYTFSRKDKLYLSGYFGEDIFQFSSSTGNFGVKIPWGNATATLRWNHLFSDKLFMNSSIIYNSYNFATEGGQLGFNFKFYSGIEDWNWKTSFDYFVSNKLKVDFGWNYTFHTLTPSTAQVSSQDTSAVDFSTDDISPKYGHEEAVYASLDYEVSKRIKINAGLRVSAFQQVGPYQFIQEENGAANDTVDYGVNELVQNYWGPEPRISARFLVDDASSIKASVARTKQYLHLVSNSTTTLPTDVWVPSSALVEPQNSIQYAVGYFRNFLNDEYEASVEVYYKDLENQLEFEDGYTQSLNEEIERSFVTGEGRSYGLELFFKKKFGKFNGFVGYTWSKTLRDFPDLNGGEEFFAKFDRRHDLSVVASYQLTDRLTASGTFIFATGNAITFPLDWYVINNELKANYGARNNFRMADYHRADFSLTYKGKQSKKLKSEWVFSVYNLYNRWNQYVIFFDESENGEEIAPGISQPVAKQISLFPILPSITWNFKF